jgi:ketosteroid isomerase-like protein
MKTLSCLIAGGMIGIGSAVLLGFAICVARSSTLLDQNASKSSMEQQVVSKEREELEALKSGDSEAFGNLIAEDAVFVNERGAAGKAQLLRDVAGAKLTDYAMDNVEFRRIAANTGLITYKMSEKGISHGNEFAGRVYASAVWTQRGAKWVCLFSQETPAQ